MASTMEITPRYLYGSGVRPNTLVVKNIPLEIGKEQLVTYLENVHNDTVTAIYFPPRCGIAVVIFSNKVSAAKRKAAAAAAIEEQQQSSFDIEEVLPGCRPIIESLDRARGVFLTDLPGGLSKDSILQKFGIPKIYMTELRLYRQGCGKDEKYYGIIIINDYKVKDEILNKSEEKVDPYYPCIHDYLLAFWEVTECTSTCSTILVSEEPTISFAADTPEQSISVPDQAAALSTENQPSQLRNHRPILPFRDGPQVNAGNVVPVTSFFFKIEDTKENTPIVLPPGVNSASSESWSFPKPQNRQENDQPKIEENCKSEEEELGIALEASERDALQDRKVEDVAENSNSDSSFENESDSSSRSDPDDGAVFRAGAFSGTSAYRKNNESMMSLQGELSEKEALRIALEASIRDAPQDRKVEAVAEDSSSDSSVENESDSCGRSDPDDEAVCDAGAFSGTGAPRMNKETMRSLQGDMSEKEALRIAKKASKQCDAPQDRMCASSFDDTREKMFTFDGLKRKQHAHGFHAKDRSDLEYKVGNVKVILRKGNISDQKVDCIVNIVSPKWDRLGTYVSKAIVQKAGKELEEQYEIAFKHDRRWMSLVTGGGNLNCSQVVHVRLTDEAEACNKTIGLAMKDIKQACHDSKLSSVAIPPLGVGIVYGYQASDSAQSILKGIQEHFLDTKIKTVYIVIFGKDSATHTEFKKIFENSLEHLHPHTIFNPKDEKKEARQRGRQQRSEGMSMAKPSDTRKNDKDQYTLRGFKQDVEASSMQPHRSSKKRPEKTRKNNQELLKSMATKDPEVPKYWKNYHPGETIMNVLRKYVHKLTNKRRIELDHGSPEFNGITEMILGTFNAENIGLGNDAKRLKGYNTLKVIKIERVENLELFMRYANERIALFGKCFRNKGFEKIHKLPKSTGRIKTAGLWKVLPDIYQDVNEYYFFHGTKEGNVDAICRDGLDEKFCDDNAMFGRGIYGAESSTKADQYVDEEKNRSWGPGKEKKMFLIRMLLGDSFICSQDNPPKYILGPCKGRGCYSDKCKRHEERFDSVIGDIKTKLYREFVVYNKSQCYPEYLITYERIYK